MQLRSVDEVIEKGDVGFEIRVGTKGGCLKGEKMERKQREKGNCQGGTEGAQTFLRGIDSFPLALVTRDYQGLLCSSYLKEVWVGKLSRGWSRKGEFIRLCSRVSGNSSGYENQAFGSWELVPGWGWEGPVILIMAWTLPWLLPFRQNLVYSPLYCHFKRKQ